MLLFRNVLTPFAGDLKENLWRRAGDKRLNPDERFRSLVALASFDVGDPRWREFGGQAVEQLLRQPSVYLGDWSKALKPVAASLTIPLGDVFRGKVHPDKREFAAEVLADYAADDPRLLADLLMDADQEQFAFIFPKFKEHGEQGLLLLTAEIDKMPPPDLPSSDANRDILAKRQANAAVALLRLNQPERVWPLLKHSPDPRVRSYLIHRLSPLGADAKAVAQRLREEPDVTIRRALLLALGEFSDDECPRQDREALIPMLQEIYRADHDAGLHAAAEWLLRQWKQDIWLTKTNAEWAKDGDFRAKKIAAIQAVVSKDKTETPPDWYVNTQGQTFVVIPGPVEFEMGSPETDAGHSRYQTRHKKRIGRTFALAAKSVTLADYEKFSAGYGDAVKRTVRTPDSPVVAVSWFMAVEYCNWLSKKEGLPESEWCYEPLEDSNALPALAASTVGLLVVPATGHGLFSAACSVHPGRTDGKYSPGMKLAADYLKRRGYRLPTEAEIEYATRAGASTSRFFGETDDLLNKYAWYLQNSQQRTWPVGTLKPNDFGLFDVQGNVATWCQERFMLYSKETTTLEDCEDVRVVSIQPARPSRGGSWVEVESKLRSAMRSSQDPTTRVLVQGFRLARTV
jgi:formylglycine-generating enzyme required for sulfatase activity